MIVLKPLVGWLDPGAIFGDVSPAVLAAKLVGALAGSLISIAYILPRGRREAFARLCVGLVTGLIFGGTAGIKIADFLGLLGKLSNLEVALIGAAFASLTAWWALGVLERLAQQLPDRFKKTIPHPNQREQGNSNYDR
jgi:hypothetical protein